MSFQMTIYPNIELFSPKHRPILFSPPHPGNKTPAPGRGCATLTLDEVTAEDGGQWVTPHGAATNGAPPKVTVDQDAGNKK